MVGQHGGLGQPKTTIPQSSENPQKVMPDDSIY
jgi:hypothetical protein